MTYEESLKALDGLFAQHGKDYVVHAGNHADILRAWADHSVEQLERERDLRDLTNVTLEADKLRQQERSRALVRDGEKSQDSMCLIARPLAKRATVRHRVLSSDDVDKDRTPGG